MKKIFALVLATIFCVGALAGCGEKPAGGGANETLKEGETLQGIVEKIDSEIGIQMPAVLEDQYFKDLFYIDVAADTDEAFGMMSMSMTSADNVVAVKAKADQRQTVLDALNKRLDDVKKSFEQYLPDQKEKSDKGVVIEKGDYLFLVIIGSDVEKFDSEMEKAKQIINEAFA